MSEGFNSLISRIQLADEPSALQSIRRAERELLLRILIFRRIGRRRFRHLRFSGWIFPGWRLTQADERRTQKPALKRESRRGGFGNHGVGGRLFFPVNNLLALGIERFIRRGGERNEADAPRGVAAGVLKVGNLFRQFRLAGARGGGVQYENMIKDAHQHLQPFALAAPELLDFQPERGLLAVVHFLHELGELPDFPRHFLGDFVRAIGNFFGLRLDVQPFVRRGGNLRGERFEVLDFFADGAERAGFDDPDDGAVIQNERQRAEHRAERDAGGGCDDFPAANRVRRVLDEKIRGRQQQRVAEQKRPFGNRPVFRVVHAASFGKIRRGCKPRRRFLLD